MNNCNNARLHSADELLGTTRELAAKHGFTVVKTAHHQFTSPSAATITLILSQSHLILHTWPEHRKVAFDIFACTDKNAVHNLINSLCEYLQGKISSLRMIDYE